MKHYLSIDFGTARVGVALAWTSIADPLVVLPSDETLNDQLFELILEHSPDVIVVGMSEQAMAEKTRQFTVQFKEFLAEKKSQEKLRHMPEFVFADETLSSHEVQQKLYQSGKSRLRQHGPIDHYAAAHLLQDYLDLHQYDDNR